MRKNPKIVLYCGMADDIMAPLLLVPDVDIIYAIDYFDPAFSPDGSIQGQTEEIKLILQRGNDKHTESRRIYEGEFRHDHRYSKMHRRLDKCNSYYKDIHYLHGKSMFIRDAEMDIGCQRRRWELIFHYNGKTRILIYYRKVNFLNVWPDEIKDLTDIMTMGATFPLQVRVLADMVKSRSRNMYTKYYHLNHGIFEQKQRIFNGRGRCGTILEHTTLRSLFSKYLDKMHSLSEQIGY
jgi:hypothetical protein